MLFQKSRIKLATSKLLFLFLINDILFFLFYLFHFQMVEQNAYYFFENVDYPEIGNSGFELVLVTVIDIYSK